MSNNCKTLYVRCLNVKSDPLQLPCPNLLVIQGRNKLTQTSEMNIYKEIKTQVIFEEIMKTLKNTKKYITILWYIRVKKNAI